MSRPFRLARGVRVEIREAADWYRERDAHVANRFIGSVDRAIRRAAQWPDAGAPVEGTRSTVTIRRVPVGRFPYRPAEPTTTRRVGKTGKISFAAQLYPVGVWLAGETVEVSVANGLVSIHHRGVLVATHVQRHRPAKEAAALARKVKQKRARPRQATVGPSVTRKVTHPAACRLLVTNT